MTTTQIGALTAQQIAALEAEDITQFTQSQMSAFNAEAFGNGMLTYDTSVLRPPSSGTSLRPKCPRWGRRPFKS